ncbi:nucleoside-diphosphate kinase [Kitasatospora sp. NPDC058063]|uniref:nucleoside-diphosphate kinase n=1 Tax=unclassified Kitasatospora TaxID=2633591 RepID=UPI0036DE18E3
MTYTLLMVKPDAMGRPEVLAAVESEIAAAGLTGWCVHDVTLTRDQARVLFPSFDEACYPLTRVLLLSYLTSGPVRFMVLSGERALADGKAVRRAIRSEFAVGNLANCLHAAADSAEAARQLAWLETELGVPARWSRAVGDTPPAPAVELVPGISGRLAGADLEQLGRAVWAGVRDRGWAGLRGYPVAPEQWSTWLVSDDRNSLDYAVSALLQAHPGWSAELALEAVLKVDLDGGAAVFAGGEPEVAGLARELAGLGMTVRVEPPALRPVGVG